MAGSEQTARGGVRAAVRDERGNDLCDHESHHAQETGSFMTFAEGSSHRRCRYPVGCAGRRDQRSDRDRDSRYAPRSQSNERGCLRRVNGRGARTRTLPHAIRPARGEPGDRRTLRRGGEERGQPGSPAGRVRLLADSDRYGGDGVLRVCRRSGGRADSGSGGSFSRGRY